MHVGVYFFNIDPISLGTAVKYASYSRALLRIESVEPQLFSKILSGQFKMSHENVVNLSKLSEKEIKIFNVKFNKNSEFYVRYKKTRKIIQSVGREKEIEKQEKVTSIKDMPEFDPDADIVGLVLTIPSWTSSIRRVREKTDFSGVSVKAKSNLTDALKELCDTVTHVLNAMGEV